MGALSRPVSGIPGESGEAAGPVPPTPNVPYSGALEQLPARRVPISQSPRVTIGARATKVAQLIGDYDAERKAATTNQTWSRYKLLATDLGVPFRHKGRLYFLFGDTVGINGGDAIAYSTDTTPEDGIDLTFLRDPTGAYRPIDIPGIDQGYMNVPMAGVSIGGRMYVYHTTDGGTGPEGDYMGRSVVAVSEDDGRSFALLYELSRRHFINVSIVEQEAATWPGLPMAQGPGLLMFGSGEYRRSSVYLAFQPSAEIDSSESIRYWAGLDSSGEPIWSTREESSQLLFDQPCVGELSVTYNPFIRKWIMLYNCGVVPWRGINLRTADQPWGPWSKPQFLFDPWVDKGYCYFIHASWQYQDCDQLSAVGSENIWGGEYGPYQVGDFATGDESSTKIYFTLSTWNPYTVVLMQATLKLQD